MRVGRIGALAAAAGLLASLAAAAPSADATSGVPGGRIAFAVTVHGNRDLYTIKPDGTGLRRLTSDPALDFHPAYSRDGRRVAFVRSVGGADTELWVVAADGTRPRRVLRSDRFATCPDLSPDGRRIAFAQFGDGAAARIWTVRTDGTGLTQLTHVGEADGQQDSCPAWSPDGTRIAFSRMHGYPETAQLWIVSADGTASRPITRSTAIDATPDWSPDGSRLLFVRDQTTNGGDDPTVDYDLWTVRPDGTAPTRITTSHAVKYGPIWSPDGRGIAFSRPVADEHGRHPSGIYLVRPDGTGERLVRAESDPVYDLSWQPLPR